LLNPQNGFMVLDMLPLPYYPGFSVCQEAIFLWLFPARAGLAPADKNKGYPSRLN
jgi:hypothetical protein